MIVEIAEVKAVDPLTLEIRTRQPNPVLLNKLAFIMIVPDDAPDAIVQPLGTGPFRWVSSTEGTDVVLERKRLILARNRQRSIGS